MAVKRSERIVNLVIALLTTDRPLTREEIRDAVEGYRDRSEDGFRRAFERDKEALRSIGIQVQTMNVDTYFGDEIGYRIPRSDFELPPVQFTQAEADVLAMAARVWRESVLDESSSSALLKLRAAGVEPDTEAGVPTQITAGVDDAAFPELWRATLERTPVAFEYRGQQTRRVEPWRIVLRRGHWYLLGQDLDKEEPRIFRLSRITSEVSTQGSPGSVVRPDRAVIDAHLERLEPPGGEPVTARVRLRSGTRLSGVDTRAMEPSRPNRGDDEPGWYEAEVTASDHDQLADSVLRAGGRAVILAPEELRGHLADRMSALRKVSWFEEASR